MKILFALFAIGVFVAVGGRQIESALASMQRAHAEEKSRHCSPNASRHLPPAMSRRAIARRRQRGEAPRVPQPERHGEPGVCRQLERATPAAFPTTFP